MGSKSHRQRKNALDEQRRAEAIETRQKQHQEDVKGLNEISSVVAGLPDEAFSATIEVLRKPLYSPKKWWMRSILIPDAFTLEEYRTGTDYYRRKTYYSSDRPPEQYEVAEVIGGLVIPGVFVVHGTTRSGPYTHTRDLVVTKEQRLWDNPTPACGPDEVYGVEKDPFINHGNFIYRPEGCPALSEIAKKIGDYSRR